jgi:uncharacterized protein YcbK (DUF882 family)
MLPNPDGAIKRAVKRVKVVVDPGQLTPNFHLREFRCKDAARTPVPKASRPALKRLCKEILEPLRAEFGPATVMSGYRTRAYNDTLNGAAEHSYHIYNEHPGHAASDVIFVRGNPVIWFAFASRLNPFGGVGRYVRSGFIHVDNRGYRARWFGN